MTESCPRVRVLYLDSRKQRFQLRTIGPASPPPDARIDTTLLWGETLCQYLLMERPDTLIIARGPLVFMPGNKATLGYMSPLTGLPHYSFVGGRGCAELLNLGLDAIVLTGGGADTDSPNPFYVTVVGRAPDLTVTWKSADPLPPGQRSAYYWLLEHELSGERQSGSVFTLGSAALHGYRSANVAVDGIYHAGRGGAGHVMRRFARAIVIRGAPMSADDWLGSRAELVLALHRGELTERLEAYCGRLSRRDGGTVTKLYATGQGPDPTLPSRNAQRLGYALADLGARKTLTSTRVGQEGCHWCHVSCRHWHWVDVDYAPEKRDRYLDDFEPTYALYSMLDLRPVSDTLSARLQLLDQVDRQLVVPIEQLGCDIIDVGVGIAALFEGLETGLIPQDAVPEKLRAKRYFGHLDLAAGVVAELADGTHWPGIRALGSGPQALVELYPALQPSVFTCGSGTLANAGHANALWTFLMPFSRYFGHYVGQIYKVRGDLIPDMAASEITALFERVVDEMLLREQFSCLGAALSACAFTFVAFSEDGEGLTLDRGDLLVRTLAAYGYNTRRDDLIWFAEAYWAQSVATKLAYGWQPPSASEIPERVYAALSQVLRRTPDDLRSLMNELIAVWTRRAAASLLKWGYDATPMAVDGARGECP